MQKKLLALAIAGLSSAAFAQSNVTIYGVADLNVENVEIDGQSAVGVTNVPNKMRAANNSSYIGFKGVEDLGNGLKAVFQLETSITLGANADNVGGAGAHAPASNQFGASRDSYIGLAGNFGTVAIGTLTGPYRALGNMVSYSAGNSGALSTTSITGTIGGVKTTTDDRTTNAVAYISPTFNGFSAVVAYSADANKNETTAPAVALNGRLWTLGLNYTVGGLTAGYAFIDAKDPQVASATVAGLGATIQTALGLGAATSYNDQLKAHRLAGKYDFGQGTTVTLLWDKQKYEIEGNSAALPGDKLERTAWQIGAGHKFGANTVALEYAQAKKIKTNAGDLADTQAKQWTLSYQYDMSKRTALRAYWSEIKNDASSGVDFYNNPVAGIKPNGDPRVLGAGIRHSF